jgi:prepilin-type processing-associated H-X9-DG protein
MTLAPYERISKVGLVAHGNIVDRSAAGRGCPWGVDDLYGHLCGRLKGLIEHDHSGRSNFAYCDVVSIGKPRGWLFASVYAPCSHVTGYGGWIERENRLCSSALVDVS